MSFAIRRLPIAEDDAFNAAAWYEKKEAGLGYAFLDEVELAIQKLRKRHHSIVFDLPM